MTESDSQKNSGRPAASLSELPADELLRYGSELGLDLSPSMPPEHMARLVRERQALLAELERDALLDIVVWGRRPVRKSAAKEHLAREIHRIQQTDYDDLSTRGLYALARLRGIDARPSDSAESLIDHLERQDGLWKRLSRKRRAIVGSVLSKLFDDGMPDGANEYCFLPEEPVHGAEGARPSLREQVEQHGVVGGIAQRIRGAADDYIRVKLDEIETRIDQKLEQIDKRLAEWRDREIQNRLRILRITLIFSVLVAVLSLGYNFLKKRVVETDGPAASRVSVPDE